MKSSERRRRGNKEGSIRCREDRGHWTAQASIRGRRLSKSFPTRAKAQAWIRQIQRMEEDGLSAGLGRLPTEKYLEMWLNRKQASLAPKTHLQYQQTIWAHVSPSLGRIRLAELRASHIQSMLSEAQERGVRTRSLNLIRGVLHKALEDAKREGDISLNPVDLVEKRRYLPPVMQTLDDHQASQLLIAARGTRLEALYHLAITAGLRKGELLGLKWQDVDWERRLLAVQRQAQRIAGGGIILRELKTTKSRRAIALGPSTLEALGRHRQRQEWERAATGEGWQESDLVFPSAIGTAMDQRNLTRDFKRVLERAGLPPIRFHDLRHTAATLMLKEGIHPKIAAERLGHSDVSTTLRIYSHAISTLQQEAAEKLDALVTPIPIAIDRPGSDNSGEPEGLGGLALAAGDTRRVSKAAALPKEEPIAAKLQRKEGLTR